MKLIPCAPPRGPLNVAPLTDLVTPVMRQLEVWDAFWGEDDAYYTRLTQNDSSARWFRVGPEAGTPAFGVAVVPDAQTPSSESVAARAVRAVASRGVVLYARVRRGNAHDARPTRLAWSVATRGPRIVRAPRATLVVDASR